MLHCLSPFRRVSCDKDLDWTAPINPSIHRGEITNISSFPTNRFNGLTGSDRFTFWRGTVKTV
jgi:hypothetical protein